MNLILWGTAASFLLAETLKIMLDAKRGLPFRLLRQGGMPSVHAALVTSVTTSIYLVEGATSTFFLSLVVAGLFLNDAFNVREEAGKHAALLNQHFKLSRAQKLRERLGHKPLEVAAGVAIGIIIPLLLTLVN